MKLGEVQSIADKIRRETGASRVAIVIGEGPDAMTIASTDPRIILDNLMQSTQGRGLK